MKVGIFVFDGVEVLDFAGPFEVFTTANRVAKKLQVSEGNLFDVGLIGLSKEFVTARAGLKIWPDMSLSDVAVLDVLLVPGGVVDACVKDAELIGWIRQQSAQVPLIASICTGAFVLAEAGLLNGKSATTHWEDIPDLTAQYPLISVQSNVRWVDEGALVTSAGISAGIDMSLHLIERLVGRQLALATAKQLEFDWTENA
ncbi:DJ-1/PfpI family protein [Leeia sp. TBRC 13508]|uniref:DJ-1/PfpI family protein n=1 Tax=Leeia speluncae TaxID=2884804 RepID=A0ABS8D582_9NEIS|nr:DJ-1/PfpI family protein [Leeia speluncae]MCB6183353.1 DJ-1/PfpI family protein [Leeia speluncae]